MLSLILILLLFGVSDTFQAFISSPGIQRKNEGDTCTFQWTVSSSLTGYSVYNFTTGTNVPLSANADYTADTQYGIVTLTIRNIQLRDAGNYSLFVNTGTGPLTDSSALLFVYGYMEGFVNQTFGPVPATQGQTVELTCTMISKSLPIAYRPTTIYYSWYISKFNSFLKNINSGPAVLENGDILNGYSIKNDGRTLVIDSVQYPDTQGIQCYGQEEGSVYSYTSDWFYLQLGLNTTDNRNVLLIAVIILAILLGLAVLALIGCLIYNQATSTTKQANRNVFPRTEPRGTQETNVYDNVDMRTARDKVFYTSVNEQNAEEGRYS